MTDPHDATHEILERRIAVLTRKLTELEADVWTLKDAFYHHAHLPDGNPCEEREEPFDHEPS